MQAFRISTSVLASGLAVGLAALPSARADKFVTPWGNDPDWHFEVLLTHVPDFDQVRDTLPNNGLMYCVPTAHMNWLAYIANHGFPQVEPGAGWWQAQVKYGAATWAVWQLGSGGYMMTDPNGGTDGGNGEQGIKKWLNDPATAGNLAGKCDVIHYYANGNYAPTLLDLGKYARNDGLVVPIVGWYENGPQGTIWRNGGHALTLTKVNLFDWDNKTISWRDPADEQTERDAQSWFVSQTYKLESEFVTVLLDNGQKESRAMEHVVDYNGDRTFLDEVFFIYPKLALTAGGDGMNLKLFKLFKWTGHASELTKKFDVGLVSDIAPHPAGLDPYYLTPPQGTRPAQLWRLDLCSGRATPVASFADAKRLTFSRHQMLYVLDGRELRLIDPDPDYREIRRVTLSEPVGAIAYDDRTDTVLALAPADRRIYKYNADLTGAPQIVTLPTSVVLSGAASLDVDSQSFPINYWFTSVGSPALYCAQVDSRGGVAVTAVGGGTLHGPAGVNVGDDGHVFISDAGVIREFARGHDGRWQETRTSGFTGMPAGPMLRMSRSRSNFDPAVHTGPNRRNVLPTRFHPGIPDELGDLNCDGVVDFFDIDAFMLALTNSAAYAAAHPGCDIRRADANADGVVDFFDIDAFIALVTG